MIDTQIVEATVLCTLTCLGESKPSGSQSCRRWSCRSIRQRIGEQVIQVESHIKDAAGRCRYIRPVVSLHVIYAANVSALHIKSK